jgi:hypothetical protein
MHIRHTLSETVRHEEKIGVDIYALDNGGQTSTRSDCTLDNDASSARHFQKMAARRNDSILPYLSLGLAALETLG